MNIIANVRVTPATQKYLPVENDKILNFMLTTTLKNIKDTEDIPKYSFKFINIDMLSERINVDMYLSGSITDFIFFYTISLILWPSNNSSYSFHSCYRSCSAHWTSRRNHDKLPCLRTGEAMKQPSYS